MQVQGALRQANLNAVLSKPGLHGPIVGGVDGVGASHGIGIEPYHEFKLEPAVAKADQPHLRCASSRAVDVMTDSARGFQPGFLDRIFVRAERDRKGKAKPQVGAV